MQGNPTWRLMMGAAGTRQRPTLVNYAVSSTNDAQVSSMTMTMPAGVQNGDLIVACVCAGKGTVSDWIQTSFTWAIEQNTVRPCLAIAYRVASSEPASYVFTTSTSRALGGAIFAFRGAAWDVAGSVSTSGVASGLTATSDLSVLLGFWASDPSNNTFSTPSGMAITGAGYQGGNRPNWELFTQGINAGATGTRTSTLGNSSEVASALVAIKPA
jgi:hypothetical protein